MASTATTFDTDCKLMLHCDGADGSTNFVDSSVSVHSVGTNGNIKLDTTIKKFGTASAECDNSGDYLTVQDSLSDFSFGTDDFTVDFWFYFNASASINGDFLSIDSIADTSIYVRAGDGGTWYAYISGTQINNIQSFNKEEWIHFALVRSGTTGMIFLGGTLLNSAAMTGNVSADNILKIGQDTDAFYGWIDEYRIVKGTAVWTSNFTPPTAAYTNANAASDDNSFINLPLLGVG